MGLDPAAVKFLCCARKLGVDFGSVAMIGRQAFFPDPSTLARVFEVLGIERDAQQFLAQPRYAEEFFSLLGARQVDSVDLSSYEGATILHDMNRPIAPELHNRFTLVHDGGTIEHVFNITQAFKNCMEMVRVGGHFTQVICANNFTGHGFWQISPELIFRTFSRENGYELEAVLMHEVVTGGAWYVVSDPDHVRRRIELCNSQPTYILAVARRVAVASIFERTPQQSDYVRLWATLGSSTGDTAQHRVYGVRPPSPTSTAGVNGISWRHYVPEPLKQVVRSARRRLFGPDNQSVIHGFERIGYHHISEDDVLHGRLSRGSAGEPPVRARVMTQAKNPDTLV
jgi:hypothetical protein